MTSLYWPPALENTVTLQSTERAQLSRRGKLTLIDSWDRTKVAVEQVGAKIQMRKIGYGMLYPLLVTLLLSLAWFAVRYRLFRPRILAHFLRTGRLPVL